MTTSRGVNALLRSRPRLELALRQLLQNSDDEPWAQSELPFDESTVIELVECSVLEECEGGYRIADPEGVRTAIDAESDSPPTDSVRTRISHIRRFLLRRRTLALTPMLAFVAAVRLFPLPDVHREGSIVLSSNDPYLYRYLVDRVTRAASSPLDLGVLLGFPAGVTSGEPLMVATLSVIAELFGGGAWVTGTVLAWYPVVSALVTGVVVYLLATHLTGDTRVGLAAVGFFAVIPGHAFRTGFGFADHHAFDYLWLAITALAFVRLATECDNERPWSRRTTASTVALGVGVAGQVLAWEGAPLLLFPLVLGIAAYGPLAVRHGRLPSLLPILVGLAMGAILSLLAHVALGWQSPLVVAVPTLLATGALAVAVGALAVDRVDVPAPGFVLVGGEVACAILIALAVGAAFPDLLAELGSSVASLNRQTSIGEMQSLVDQWGVLFGPLIMLGFTPFLALPAMVWALWQVEQERYGLFLVNIYAWTFLGLAFIQRRFTGELAPFVAVFAALGFVVLLSMLDLAQRPRGLRRDTNDSPRNEARADSAAPDPAPTAPHTGPTAPGPNSGPGALQIPGRRRFLMLGTFAAVLTAFPALFTCAIHSMLTIDPRKYEAARWMDRYAADHGWEYPRNYVFSEWGLSRMYNYVVSGESKSYAYARRNYGPFLTSQDPTRWYKKLRGRSGFIVTTDADSVTGLTTRMQERLHKAFGSRFGSAQGLAHYRAVYASEDGFVKVFTLVPGATIEGTIDATESTDQAIRTEVSIEDATFEYRRRVDMDADGTVSVTVAHPGEYRIGDRRVVVSEHAVVSGETVQISSN